MAISTVPQRMLGGFDNFAARVSESVLGSPVRLGVTGLARSGKTVFITSLIANLYHRLYHLTVAQSRFVIDDIRLGSFSKKFHALWHLSRISS